VIRQIRALSLVVLSFCAAAASGSEDGARNLSLTEINLNWFGLNGSPFEDRETRAATIKQFLKTNKLMADVMVFVEIVDLEMLQDSVLGTGYKCQSYARKDPRHQYVAICHLLKYRFDLASGHKTYALEEVDVTGRLRPAVHGVLKTKSGEAIAHIFGVHLKAMPDQSAVRLQQTKAVSQYLSSRTEKAPVIIVGDVNTFGNDADRMSTIFSKNDLVEAVSDDEFTWAKADGSYEPAKFDRVWVSSEIEDKIVSNEVVGPCNDASQKELAQYNSSVSDHCAVAMELKY
jgi:endonuclease/exonuclease/phosphatase family metal-dependent hydrolase